VVDTPAKPDDANAGGCPYTGLPDHAFWSRSVAGHAVADVDPLTGAPFKIMRSDRIASAGSCFAQHISRRLTAAGYNYLVTEAGYPRMGARLGAKYNYGTFSARYGNIYTARQLSQLFDRAYGTFVPSEPFWHNGDLWIDPFRPMIQPGGFETLQEAELDRAQHLKAVRTLMESLDVFIFTFGLTESWVCKGDGAVLPVCPGCGAGTFDPAAYAFKNFEMQEVEADFAAFAGKLRKVNPKARILLTVSPVPLVATYSGNHVLPATTYSKSVLRVAADRIVRTLENCAYFPSYEIITGAFSRGAYFQNDLRSVEEAGVDHVMASFFRNFAAEPPLDLRDTPSAPRQKPAQRNLLDAVCEEYASLNGAVNGR
jgi:hypothetical protein